MFLPTRMRAAYVTAHGPAEAIGVGELPVPAVGPADVLVAVQVLAVNPVDTFIRSGCCFARNQWAAHARARLPGARASGGPG